MDQKNRSQKSMYLKDFKHTNQEYSDTTSKSVEENSKNSFSTYLVISVLCLFAVGGYYSYQNPELISNQFSKTTQENNQSTDNNAFEPLDLDLIENIELAQEPRTTAIIAEPQSDNIVSTESTLDAEIAEENWISVTIKKGDSLSKIFDRHNLSHKDAIGLATTENLKSLNYLMVGQNLEIQTGKDNSFKGLKYQVNRLKSIVVNKDSNGEFLTETHEVEPTVRIRDVTAPIEGNLFSTAENLNISNRVIGKLSSIFRWDIDFARDIQNGDRFSVIFQEKSVDGEVMATGDILAAEFIINGNIVRAIRHEDKDGDAHYYTPEGKSLKKAFMRNPLKFVNITSGFTHRRYHPVLKKWRAHKGVDYGAPSGTPIMTTADGTIQHLGRKGAYGKAIVINHGEGYSSLYGHLKNYKTGLRNGSKVKQGEIIGYVGQTGLATGNHLHYEFRIGGKHVDPLAVDLPRSLPINSDELNEFKMASKEWVRRLDALQGQSVAYLNSSLRSPPSI